MQKILIVDDEESICEILQFNLEIEGYEADVAYSAEQALKMDLKSYSLILLDIMMGGMSGFKMAQLLKRIRPRLRFRLFSVRPKILKTIR